ncbi:hypothetical protein L6452_09580 [Arctium lappa]|uniref:Uncharacterized protein n=1 Tax=Arctium lappa TaxID=4217 RepID=A0ACB9DKX7_ARCLA|nr:hypothetical protein L6452_09580 [Arctium lappa]
MADFEPPSFYLGIDFDLLDSEPRIVAASEANKDSPVSNRSSGVVMILEDDGNDFETLTVESDTKDEGSPLKPKRLWRVPTVDVAVSSASVKSKAKLDSAVIMDDDNIEEFSHMVAAILFL